MTAVVSNVTLPPFGSLSFRWAITITTFLYQTVDGCHGNPARVKLYPNNVIACVTNGWFRFPAHQKGESFAIKHMENGEMNDKADNVITLLFRQPHKKHLIKMYSLD